MNTQVLPVNEESIALAAKLLQQGELVALPTETVYGIAADARNGEAVKKIFAGAHCAPDTIYPVSSPANDFHSLNY